MVTEAQYPEQPLPSSSERHVLKSTTHRSILDLAGMVVKRHPRGSGFWLHSQLLNELRAFASHSHYTVLHYAAARADLLLVRTLIQMGAPYDAVHRYIDETGAERHGVMPVEVVRSSEHHHAAEVVDYLTSIDNAFRRVRADDITWMRKWLAGQVEKPMDARDMRGRTMLHYAQSLKMARLLVGHGATVNVYDDRDISPLGVFIGMDRMDIVRWLLVEQGADVDPSVAMVRPLHRAASLPNGLAFVKLLVEHGASVTAVTGGARAEQVCRDAMKVRILP